MRRLLEFLWSGCWHRWEPDGERMVQRTTSRHLPTGIDCKHDRPYQPWRCTKCGRSKREWL